MFSFTSSSGRVITLRSLQEGDEQLLFDYAKTIETEDTYILLNPGEPVTWIEETEYIKGCLSKVKIGWQIFYLAFHENTLIGTAQITKKGRRKMHSASFGISLLPSYRGDGIGKAFALFMLSEAKKLNLSQITLELFASNLTALKLYESLGFIEYGRLPSGLNHKNVLVDEIFMHKTLSNTSDSPGN